VALEVALEAARESVAARRSLEFFGIEGADGFHVRIGDALAERRVVAGFDQLVVAAIPQVWGRNTKS
jgi:hypothetical protein